MLFQEENRARPETMYAFSRRKQGKARNNVCFFKKKTGQGQKQCMLFQEENRARPVTMYAFSRRYRARPVTKYDFSRGTKQGKISNCMLFQDEENRARPVTMYAFSRRKQQTNKTKQNRELDSVVTLLCTLGLCFLQMVKIVTEAAWVKETKVS